MNSLTHLSRTKKNHSTPNHGRAVTQNDTTINIPDHSQSVFPEIRHNLKATPLSHDSTSKSSAVSMIQRKVKISSPGDKYEQEADRIADKVMKTGTNEQPHPATSAADHVMRKCSMEENEEEIQRSAAGSDLIDKIFRQEMEEEEEEEIQAKQEPNAGKTDHARSVQGIKLPGAGGRPMAQDTLNFFESRFGHDFSNVRIHHDSESGRAASAVNAKAFTHKNNIVFGKGQYNPNSFEGRKLLAHELTHVIQQGKSTKIAHTKSPVSLQKSSPALQKKDGPGKVKKSYPTNLKAQKLLWDDIHAFFPDDGRKLAGTGYKESIDQLETDFTEEKSESKSVSAPIVYVGKKYLKEDDAEKRKATLEQEIKKIDKWRLKVARIDNKDLDNTEITANLQDMSAAVKLSYIGKLEEKKYIENDEVVAYIKKVMQSTPIVEGATFRSEGGFTVKYDNVEIIVLPDVFNSSEVSSGAETQIETVPDKPEWFSSPGYEWDSSGKITKMDYTPKVPDIVYTVQTHYSSGATPRSTSGYGVGTRAEDTDPEEKTLGHHEGAHGEEFIQSIKAGTSSLKYPVYTGKIGDDHKSFIKAHKKYVRDQDKFKEMIDKALEDNIQVVDCSGKTIEEYHKEHGTSTKVKCN
jgi:hypothetical protein